MAEEAQIVNRIVVQGIDEAKAQVQSLKQLLNETKTAYEQARRSTDQQGMFQGDVKGADELKRLVNDIQLQIRKLNTEISQGDFGAREKALNEELKIRQRISQQAEQQSARELADQQRLIEQMASGRERAMTQAASREAQMNAAQVARINSAAEQERASREKNIAYESSVRQKLAQQEQSLADQMANYREISAVRTATREAQMNTAQVARINSAAEQEMQARQKVLDYESTVRQKLAQQAAKQSIVDSIGGVGSQASYAKQMSTLSANIEESYRAFQRGAIGSTEYATALDKYTKGMSVAKAEQEAFSKSIGTYTSAWDSMRKRVESHASWIMAGGAIATALAIPSETISQLKEADALLAKIKQNLELAPRYQGNTAGLEEDVKNIENVAGVFSMAYGQNLKDTMEMMQVLSRRFKSPEEITYFTNLALTMAKLDFVAPKKAAEDLEATILSMGLNFEQSKRFVDEFSVAVHVARINGTDLLTGLQRSAATFHNMNFNTAEAIAMISTLSTVTAKAGANIGASLNSILINVDFKKAAEALQAYGIQVYNTSGQMRDGVEIWREIATVFNGLDTQHANEFANAMSGGKFRANDLRALIGNWQTFEQILEQVNTKASPELTASLLKTGMNTLATNVQQAQAALQVLGVTIGEQALPQLKEMTIGLATGVQWLNDHKEAVGQTVSAVGKFIEALVLYKGVQLLSTTALGGFVETLMLEIRTAPSFSAAIGSMGSAMAGFANTVGLAALRMGAFYAAARMVSELMDSSKQDENEKKFRESIAGKGSLSEIEQQTLDALNERDKYVQEKASTTFETPWGKAAVWLGTSDAESSSIEKEKKFNELNDKTRDLLAKSVESDAMSKVNAMVQEAQDKMAAQQVLVEPQVPTIEGVDLGNTGGKGPKTAPMDTSEQIQKKLDNYNVKSIEDQAAIAQSNYKSRLDAITDATNRYGKSYAFLDQTTATMNQHVKDLQATSAALSEQLQSDLQKVNDLASETGATVTIAGGGTETERLINEMAAKYNVDPRLAQAIAQVESGKNQSAISSAGAIGVMQLMPETAQGLGVNPYELSGNIEGGVSYISSLLQEFGGDLEKAIAGYNAGGGAVEKYGGIPPYAETQEYVRKVLEEYNNPSNTTVGSQQIYISGLSDTLATAGVSQESWQGMSAESKLQFTRDHKEQIRDANLLIGYLTQIAGEQKKIADYQKQISDETRKQYETLIKGIKDVEDYQNKQTDLNKRTSLAALGYYATDSDKAMAEQKATREKIAQSNAALAYAKSKGVDIFTDPTMSEERVKNLELQQQLQQQNTFATPEAAYKQRVAEIEYNQKIAQATFGNTLYDAQGKYMTSLTAAKDKVQALKDLLAEMSKEDSFAYQTETFKKYNVELVEAQKNLDTLSKEYTTKMKQGIYDVTNELLLQGKSIQDIWSNLWKKLAEDALMALMGLKNESPGLLAQALGVGKKSNQTSGVADGLNLLANATQKLGSISGEKSKQTYDFIAPNLLNSLVSGGSSGTQGSNQQKNTSQSGGTNWLSLVGSIAGMFHATGGVLNSPGIAGEDGEEVVIPVEKHKENSANLLSYAAGKLGQKSTGITADFSNSDIAKTAMNVSVNSATNMAKTNGILATQNQILTTMLNQMGQQSGQQMVYVNAGGQQQITQEELSTMLYKNQQYRQTR